MTCRETLPEKKDQVNINIIITTRSHSLPQNHSQDYNRKNDRQDNQ